MTENKPIMIDGVDITNCIHRGTNKLCGDIDPYCRCYTGSCKDITNCYFKQLTRKTQECEKKSWEIGNLGYKIKNQRKEINERLKQLKAKEQECEDLKKYLNQIRDEELSHLDIEWDEYETSARQEDYSNIITLVERALGEIDD